MRMKLEPHPNRSGRPFSEERLERLERQRKRSHKTDKTDTDPEGSTSGASSQDQQRLDMIGITTEFQQRKHFIIEDIEAMEPASDSLNHAPPNFICEICRHGFANFDHLVQHLNRHVAEDSNSVCLRARQILQSMKASVTEVESTPPNADDLDSDPPIPILEPQVLLSSPFPEGELGINIQPIEMPELAAQISPRRIMSSRSLIDTRLSPSKSTLRTTRYGRLVPSYVEKEDGHDGTQERNVQPQNGKRKIGDISKFHLHTCDVCSKEFRSESGLRGHHKSHTGEMPYSCQVCLKEFKHQAGFIYHGRYSQCSRRSRGDLKMDTAFVSSKSYSCGTCGKRFGTYVGLQGHIRNHTGEMPYSCQFCGRRFRHKAGLKYHIRSSHIPKTKTFQCELCNKCFPNATTLKSHSRFHTGEKPYECLYCLQRFAHHSGVIHHIRTCHPGQDEAYVNHETSRRWSNNQSLRLETMAQLNTSPNPDAKQEFIKQVRKASFSPPLTEAKNPTRARNKDVHIHGSNNDVFFPGALDLKEQNSVNVKHETQDIRDAPDDTDETKLSPPIPSHLEVTITERVTDGGNRVRAELRAEWPQTHDVRSDEDEESSSIARIPEHEQETGEEKVVESYTIISLPLYFETKKSDDHETNNFDPSSELRAREVIQEPQSIQSLPNQPEEKNSDHDNALQNSLSDTRNSPEESNNFDASSELRREDIQEPQSIQPVANQPEEKNSDLDANANEGMAQSFQLTNNCSLDKPSISSPTPTPAPTEPVLREAATVTEHESAPFIASPSPEASNSDQDSSPDTEQTQCRILGQRISVKQEVIQEFEEVILPDSITPHFSPFSSDAVDSDYDGSISMSMDMDEETPTNMAMSMIGGSSTGEEVPFSYSRPSAKLVKLEMREVADQELEQAPERKLGPRSSPEIQVPSSKIDGGKIPKVKNPTMHHNQKRDIGKLIFRSSKQVVNKAKTTKLQIDQRNDLSCPYCTKTFKRAYDKACHVRSHTGEKPYTCNYCGQAFSQLQNCKTHARRMHKAKGIVLQPTETRTTKKEQSVKLLTKLASTQFKVRSGPRKTHSCQYCGKTFNKGWNLTVHIRIHTGERPYACTVCGQAFKDYSGWHRHTKKGHECTAEILVKPQSTVRKHQTRPRAESTPQPLPRSPEGKKSHPCPICNKKFPSNIFLTRHLRVHTGEKPFGCKFCDMTFAREDYVYEHMRRAHSELRQFVCEKCNQSFRISHELVRHRKVCS